MSPSLPHSLDLSFCSVVVTAGNESHSSLDTKGVFIQNYHTMDDNERGLPLLGAAGPCVVL